MAIELEKKYRLTEQERHWISARLYDLGAKCEGEVFEVNTIFPLPERSGRGGVLRIRNAGDTTTLTFKHRIRSDSDIKHQTEFETEVSDETAMREIIGRLGLVASLVYEKRRTTWRLDDTEIVLDELPFGSFMEIEGTEDAIRKAESDLYAGGLEVERKTYPELTAEHGRGIGAACEARF